MPQLWMEVSQTGSRQECIGLWNHAKLFDRGYEHRTGRIQVPLVVRVTTDASWLNLAVSTSNVCNAKETEAS